MADLNSTITTMNDTIDNIKEDDAEDVRRLYEQQLNLTVDDSSEGDTMLITATNTDTDSQCDSSGWPVKKYRINRAKCSKRTRREHRTQTGSSSRITIYPTTLRYRYKHEFHGYQCQPSSRSIIKPPLSLRSMVTYDKSPVVAARDVQPKRQASLLSTTDSGYHGYSSLTSKSQSRSSSIRKSTKYRNTPPELQRSVRIQCNLLPYDEGVLNLKETRTGRLSVERLGTNFLKI